MTLCANSRSSSSRKRKQKKKEISVEVETVDKKVEDSPWDDEEDVIRSFVEEQDRKDKEVNKVQGVYQRQTSQMITEEVMSKFNRLL